ncbi:PREDICTED: DNA (cytosine-5)-methyltransferase DRM2-like [Nelumbo nucifera]|uniref:DNA (cytosine-5-)-methyltransferase n=2 Tax=Nelumbo nucifera TaxID=4432 RepID=A0A1U8B2Q9_NELNU|nr:PREDICTED: DNA (cytosine-5)-methyltransferase DRM2-like [Nelumbo nucifera]XP_010269936.1 PREDICTED: DNA (cytosine-5)-methyltransferase DRM2-like [Nelumbo nucifera]XP_010269937.1 PREDICTED: DNA (cytosine-5)-methyltransferase DRM2-like [Nelumbo nucifera]XP_010269938.1 PREDICTED: DNA (cytosine-5)-methyltransferase DRM2-like [Nelumbo nucifera]XP_010269939.1 PREDICTED: DNA (cytosine-5)-methyltransferase DRM2-like [Nelumbo nucifera]XP_010269940.1 PREDICTED: DNA (cytosine-5)-methyltransferase DRM2
MDGSSDSEWSNNSEWEIEDELEIQNFPSFPTLTVPAQVLAVCGKSTPEGSSYSNLISHFVGMGFQKNMVAKAIEENGERNAEAILETLLTHSVLEKSPPDYEIIPSDTSYLERKQDTLDEYSNIDSSPGNEERTDKSSDNEKKLLFLVEMGFSLDEASSAMANCGPGTSIVELMDFIYSGRMEKTASSSLSTPQPTSDEDELGPNHSHSGPADKKRKCFEHEDRWKRKYDSWRMNQKESRKKQKKLFENEDDETVHTSKHMVGFGVPNGPKPIFQDRTIPPAAVGRPYFYYENVAIAPKGVWSTISRFLYDIEPEFVDSMYFCAAARKRGYIHNLPIHGRFPLQPIPPLAIQEAFPLSKKWWPSWDKRTKLNCLNTCTASAKLTERIRCALEMWDEEPPLKTQKYVLYECKKWNLVWVGRNKAAPLEPDEIEMLLGYPKNHTRGGGTSRTERFRALGNSFQVDTVAFHLSVLKNMFPNGISVLSLFSGIGGAEVALHRLGIPLKNVVSIEISEINRNILRSWWDQTNQKGNLIHIADVQRLTIHKLEQFINSFGGFDLIIGGSPCNNLTGSNRVSRHGLDGKDSGLFYDYFRILDIVKTIMIG